MSGFFDTLQDYDATQQPQVQPNPKASPTSGSFFDTLPEYDASKAVAAQDVSPAQATPSPGYLSQVAEGAKQGISTIANSFSDNPTSQPYSKDTPFFDFSQKLRNLGATGNALLQMGKGVGQVLSSPVAPITSPVIAAAGKAYDATNPLSAEDTAKLAQSGITLPSGQDAINLALLGLRPSSASPVGAITKPAQPNLADVKSAATSVYNDPQVLATKVHPYQVGQTISDLNTPAFAKFNATDEPAVFNVVNEIKQAATGRAANGQAAPRPTVNQLNIWSERLGKYAGEVQTNGIPTQQAVLASNIKNKIDSLLQSAAPGWQTADQNYAAAATAKGFNNQSIKAEIKARGGDYAEKLGQAATKILQDPRTVAGLAPDDLDALRSISQGSFSQNALSKVANILGTKLKHGIGLIGGTLLGNHFGGEVGAMVGAGVGEAAATAGQSAAIAARNAIARKNIQALANSVLSKSPYVQSLPAVPLAPPNPLLGAIPATQIPNAPDLLSRGLLNNLAVVGR